MIDVQKATSIMARLLAKEQVSDEELADLKEFANKFKVQGDESAP